MISTKHHFDIPAQVEAARQSQRSALRIPYTGCSTCGKALSIAEQIEKHCEKCGSATSPELMSEGMAA